MSTTATTSDDATTLLAIRLHDGTQVQAKFRRQATLSVVAKYVQKKAQELGKEKLPFGNMYTKENGFDFQTLYPKQTWTPDVFEQTTLESANLVPKASITVVRVDAANLATKGEGTFADGKRGDGYIPPHRLKGESREEKDKFKKKLSEEEAKQKKLEKEAAKKQLEEVRGGIATDKDVRKDVDWVKLSGYHDPENDDENKLI